MAQRVDHDDAQHLPFWEVGDDDPAQSDRALAFGLSVNGRPALRTVGDSQLDMLRVLCHCGAIIGVGWRMDRSHRGASTFYYLDSQILENPETRPVTMRHIEKVITPGRELIADCAGHGRRIVQGDALLELAESSGTGNRVAKGKAAVLKLPRVPFGNFPYDPVDS